MASDLLHHTKELQNMMERYLDDANLIIKGALSILRNSTGFRQIYKASLAADAVLSQLGTNRITPSLKSLRSLDLRIPLLVATCQISIAMVELRRFIELCFWCIYFTDHPIEWAQFATNPIRGFQSKIDNPISYCAHRDLTYYSNYVLELMKGEPSGIAHRAVNSLKQILPKLNAMVHPGSMAIQRKNAPPIDDISEHKLNEFSKIQKAVFLNVCILIAAFSRNQFDRLPPMHRAYFDWLVGGNLRRDIRAGAFGLRR